MSSFPFNITDPIIVYLTTHSRAIQTQKVITLMFAILMLCDG